VVDEKTSTSKALVKKTVDDQSTWDVIYEQYVTAWEMGAELFKYVWPWNSQKQTETIR